MEVRQIRADDYRRLVTAPKRLDYRFDLLCRTDADDDGNHLKVVEYGLQKWQVHLEAVLLGVCFVGDPGSGQIERLPNRARIHRDITERRCECIDGWQRHALQVDAMRRAKQYNPVNFRPAPFEQTISAGGSRAGILVAGVRRNDCL